MKRPATPPLAHLREAIDRLDAEGLLRTRPPVDLEGKRVFCSNDYLGLASGPTPPARSGAGAARLIAGEHREHLELESALSSWMGTAAALVFSSGYAANVGTLSALAQAGDVIVSDALNHASLIDGARLSRAEVVVVPHLDVDAVRRALLERPGRRGWVVTESYFSMDADSPDLVALRRVCDDAGAALMVDEAHAVGVLGPDGRGVSASVGVVPDVLVGTLGKALGAGGAFVAGSRDLVTWLWNRARSFVFSTGLSPATAKAARLNLERARSEPALRGLTAARATELRSGLEHLGIRPLGYGHVIPVPVGDARECVRLARAMQEEGVFVQGIRPPTVPRGASRLRMTVSASQTSQDVEHVLGVLAQVWPASLR